MYTKRKPCPFCGSTRVGRNRMGLIYWLVCKDCGGAGPSAETKLGAVEEWNRRAEEVQPDEP